MKHMKLNRNFKKEPAHSNIPISLGIPAVTVSRGGIQIDGHTVNERFQPDNAFVGTQRDFILALLLAGYEDIAEPVIK